MKSKFDRQRVYDLLLTVPHGKAVTYGDLAEMLGNRRLARAVGNALHANPDGNRYPCYKVVNAKGELSRAYAFGGIEEQKRRLEAEGITVENGKVDLEKYGCAQVCATRISLCDECESEFLVSASAMTSLCPECAHIIYGYPNCDHVFRNGRCVLCLWDGSRSKYIESLLRNGISF